MRNALTIRKEIDNYKDRYCISKDKDMLLCIAILKGMYIASGGKKGIPLNNNLDFIVKYSKILFKYEKKLCASKDKLKANIWLEEELRKNGKYIGSIEDRLYNMTVKQMIAQCMADIISTEYKEDLFINSNKIYNMTLELINSLEV